MEKLDLSDYLAIAEAVLGIRGEVLARVTQLGSAQSALEAPFAGWGDVDLYPDFATKAGILCSRLIRNHPLPDGNKRTALLAMLMFIDSNGRTWAGPSQHETGDVIEALAAREVSEDAFVDWVGRHIARVGGG